MIEHMKIEEECYKRKEEDIESYDIKSYEDLTNFIEKKGWNKKHLIIDKNDRYVRIYSIYKYDTNALCNSSRIIDFICPPRGLILIKGKYFNGKEVSNPYKMILKIRNKKGNEINNNTKVRIEKSQCICGALGLYDRPFYSEFKEDYIFKKGVALYGEDMIRISLVKCLDDISEENIDFSLECDVLTKKI